jgi:flagellar hook protein FlgE
MSGFHAATARMQASADNIANPNSGGDLASQVVEQVTAQTEASISLKMIRAEHDMTQQLLDILV